MSEWSVYILRCDDRFLYTGISTDVHRRVGEHAARNNRAAKYTRSFSCIEKVYEVSIGSRGMAARIEYQIKKLSRQKKELIVAGCFSRDELMAFLRLDQEDTLSP